MPETPPELDLAPDKPGLTKGKAGPKRARQRMEQFDRDTHDKLIAVLVCFILLGAFFLYIQS
nr:hypothetical protein [uncultured Cohaesibacter sp.]